MRKGSQYTIEDYIITKEGVIINKHNNYIKKPQLNGKGYYRVCIGHKLYFVHRLVAQTFIPNPNNLPQVNHKDGNKTNNNVENLEWINNKDNRKHALENGLHLVGEKCPFSKLKDKDVIFILKNKDISTMKLAKKYNVSPSTICDIKYGRTWKQLKRYAEL